MKIVQHYKEYPWILVSSRAGTKRQLYFKVLLMSCLHNETVCSHSNPCLSLLSVSQLFFWAHNQLQVPRIHCCSVTKSCPTLCDPMDRTQHTHLPCPSPSPGVCSNSCLLSQWCYLTISSSAAPSPFTFSLSQHHCPSQWVSFSHQVTKILELHLHHQSFQWIFTVDFF